MAALAVVAMPILAQNTGGSTQTVYADDQYDMGVLVAGQTYEFPAYKPVKGEYTPSVTGPVKFKYSSSPLGLYTSPTYSEESFVNGSHSYVTGGQMMSYDKLEAGKTYYIYHSFPLSGGTLVISEGTTELAVSAVSPKLAEGEYFSVSENYTIDVSFNYPVSITNAWLIAGEERAKVGASVSNSSVTCSVADVIMDFYSRGIISKDDKVTLRILGITDATDAENMYNGNGKLEIEFLMPDKPGELVKVINADQGALANPFMSYYATDDEAGKISFVFDKELAADKTPYGKITYGDPDNLEVGVYTESVPGTIADKTATFDFTGKLRRPIDMLPASNTDTQPDNLHILFADIYTADGQRVFTNRMANPSGYSVSFKLNVIQYSVSSDFTPVRGSDIVPGTEMEIWVMNGAHVNCSGISFDYTSNGRPERVVVPMSEVKAEADPLSDDDIIYTLKVPEMTIDENTKITVSLADAECADGLDHTADFTAVFGYKTSGVEAIQAGDSLKSIDVYNVAGVCVLKNASRSALNTLPKGLYIVNGQKIAIK